MRTIGKQSWIGRALVPVLVALQTFTWHALAAAQDPDIKVDIKADLNGNGGAAWYTTWWFWVLIGLFVLIVIVALTTRGRPARE